MVRYFAEAAKKFIYNVNIVATFVLSITFHAKAIAIHECTVFLALGASQQILIGCLFIKKMRNRASFPRKAIVR